MFEMIERPALLVIDMQRAIDSPSWGSRNNPEAEQNVSALLAHWRGRAWPVVHIRYVSAEPTSTFRGEGLEFKDCALPRAGEKVITKPGACAFTGTDLLSSLVKDGIRTVVIAGVITNNSVESTARVAGGIGFDTIVVRDAAFTFGRMDYGGRIRSAEEVHDMSLANLEGQYARIVATAELLSA